MVRAILVVMLSTGVALGDTIDVPGDFSSIQAAIDEAVDGDIIDVAPGTYYETLDLLGKAIALVSTQEGFGPWVDATGLDDAVVTCVSGEGPDTIIDGFAFSGGAGFETFLGVRRGGGMHVTLSSPTVRNCVFTGNTADRGGGVYVSVGMPRFEDCIFTDNDALLGGGGVFNDTSVSVFVRCTFARNEAIDGGGLLSSQSAMFIQDCIFMENDAARGGGIKTEFSEPRIVNCLFDRNIATVRGGGVHVFFGSPSVINCSFSGNTAGTVGGGLSDESALPTVANSVLWGNTPDQVHDSLAGSITVTFCDVQGGFTGAGNINADPLFNDAAIGNLRLRSGSPCIDAGDDAAVPLDVDTDLDGNDRFVGTAVDMGAYEFAEFPSVIFGQTGSDFGESVAGLGDVNGDGVADFAVGAHRADPDSRGMVQVISGRDGAPIWTRLGVDSNSRFGSAIARSGDLNADGVDDLIVGAYRQDTAAGEDAGRIWVYSGADAAVLFTRGGKGEGDNFGRAVAGGVDVNNDGTDDVIVGAPGNDDRAVNAGLADVLSGVDGSLIVRRKGRFVGERFGSAVSGLGNADGAGGDEFIVAAPDSSRNGVRSGTVFVFRGAPTFGVLYAAVGQAAEDRFGTSVAGVGDLDGDGLADWVVGAPEKASGAGPFAGRVYAYKGNMRLRLWIRSGPPESGLGYVVSGAGDLDCDDFDDVLASGPGNDGLVRVFSGDDGAPLDAIIGSPGSKLGYGLSALGDRDGDGRVEFLIGESGTDTVLIHESPITCP